MCQLFFALLLFYSLIAIYGILRKNGLQEKINLGAFIINAVLFTFQAFALCTWYYQWSVYKKDYYDIDCNMPPYSASDSSRFACDASRNAARKKGTIYWEVCNVANFVAAMTLAYILFTLADPKKEKETKTVKVLRKPKDEPADEIERITETLDEVTQSM